MTTVELEPEGPVPRPSRYLRALRAASSGLFAAATDTVMPPVCVCCRTPLASHEGLCVACWSGVGFIRPPLCDRLGLPMPFDTGGVMVSAAAVAEPPAYDRARAVARYDGTMRRLVHDFKFRDRQEPRRLFGGWLVHAGKDILAQADVVVPVPLSRWRLWWRRFNQAALLAQEVAARSGIDYEPTVLQRTRSTRSQVGLSRAERKQNLKGAFSVAKNAQQKIAGRRVVLIDDIITTGATATAAAKALKRAGAANVDVLALAIVTGEALVPE